MRWAEEKERALCPQCKRGFDYVMTYRNLDGTVRKTMAKESVCLLKRTHWYLHHKEVGTMATETSSRSFLQGPRVLDQFAEYEEEDWDDDYYYSSNEIDDTEDFYFSNAAGLRLFKACS